MFINLSITNLLIKKTIKLSKPTRSVHHKVIELRANDSLIVEVPELVRLGLGVPRPHDDTGAGHGAGASDVEDLAVHLRDNEESPTLKLQSTHGRA